MFARTHSILTPDEKGIVDFFFEFYKWKESLSLGFSSSNSYIIGIEGKAISVDNMLIKEINSYDAIGAGMNYALAVLWLGHSATDAVKAACELCCYVAEPIITKTMNK